MWHKVSFFKTRNMILSADDLRSIADAMDKLDSLDVEVRVAKIAGHNVVMEKIKNEAKEGRPQVRYVVGLTKGELSGALGEATR